MILSPGLNGIFLPGGLKKNQVELPSPQTSYLDNSFCFTDAVVTSEEVQLRNEAHVCLFLMNHLISKLSVKEEWKIDYGITGKHALVCPCSTTDCPVKYADADDVFADLSIGKYHTSLIMRKPVFGV